MSDITRKTAYEILLKIEKEGAYGSTEILSREAEWSEVDGGFLRRLVYGVMEKKLYLDYILDRLVSKGIKRVDKKALTLLRMGLYQMLFMDSVPEYAAIDSSVELAKDVARGKDGFVNAVLRNYSREENLEVQSKDQSVAKQLSIKHSVDESIIENWIDEFGLDECEDMLSAIDADASKTGVNLRVNLMKNSREDAKRELAALGIDTADSLLSQRSLIVKDTGSIRITETDIYRRGGISIQSQESTWIADLVKAAPGQRIIDACAAPGGKTMALAESMENKGKILAWDIYDHRVEQIREQAERLGIVIADAKVCDAGEYIPELFEGFDAVLVDAPCSGFGVMSSKPEIRYKSMREVDELPDIQYKILDNCSKYVKPGGRIIYSTCTINARENQLIVAEFLRKNHWFKLEFEKQLLPQEGYKGFYAAIISH